MPMAVGEVARCSIRYSMAQGQDHVNVHYYRCTTASTQTDASLLADFEDELGTIYSNMNAQFTNTADPLDVKVDIVEFVGGKETIIRNLGTIPLTTNTVPGATGEPLPPGVAALVKLLTGIGKTYGRKFLGMLTESAQNSGVLNAGTITALEVVAAAILNGITFSASGDAESGVMSKRSTQFEAFTAYDIGSQMAYQRRRRPGTGS